MKKKTRIAVICGALILVLFCVALIVVPILQEQLFKVYTENHPAFAGRLTIPSVKIDVACYEFYPMNQDEAEEMYAAMDERDVAVKFAMESMGSYVTGGSYDTGSNINASTNIIADHSNEEFKNLKECNIGDSAFFTTKDGIVQEYVVTANFAGRNEGNDLTADGKSILQDNPGGLILYTCADATGIPVYIIFLQPVNE